VPRGRPAASVPSAFVPDAPSTLLDRAAGIEYWDRRHAGRDEWTAGGDIGISVEANRIFYTRRLGQLLEVIDMLGDRAAPPSLLDAGCGRGIISRQLAACGFAVTGVDASANAIDHARQRGGGPRYELTPLDSFWSHQLFDVVIAVDVLFHLTDPDAFAASLRRIAAHVQTGGLLVVTDRDEPTCAPLSDYIVHRPLIEYVELLGPHGFAYRGFMPYRFRGNSIGFHSFGRTGCE